ncbi:hypothetical protein JD844_004197 [Phrynosoma platyrhinos]|uniref:TNFR-Cys domain-containing protein n=1 Tax=Phrynosoma platyrhinos TaxID=52577 RepID=A0ABQ7TM33_PHRPL|nr:hypothetical protein JD844_004197 [Phrynosoma platyrhinos]
MILPLHGVNLEESGSGYGCKKRGEVHGGCLPFIPDAATSSVGLSVPSSLPRCPHFPQTQWTVVSTSTWTMVGNAARANNADLDWSSQSALAASRCSCPIVGLHVQMGMFCLSQECGYGEGSKAQCLPCQPRRFKDGWGHHGCKPCASCSLINRFEKSNCTATSNAVCGECFPG